PQQPAPHRSLMIGCVTFTLPTTIMSLVTTLARRQTAKSVRCQQSFRANIDHPSLLLVAKRAYRQRHSKDLVRPQHRIIADAWHVDHVVAAPPLAVPESSEPLERRSRQLPIVHRTLSKLRCKSRLRLHRVDPQRIAPDRFPRAGCPPPISNLRIHPRQWDARLACIEQPICRINMNLISSALPGRVDYPRQHGKQLLDG